MKKIRKSPEYMSTQNIADKLIGLLNSSPEGKLLESSKLNIKTWLEGAFLPDWALQSLLELFETEAYEELNDRFFQPIDFGTAGMRGRTIGKISSKLEIGTPSAQGTPEHPAVGSNNMNEFNVVKATLGLFNYCKTLTEIPSLVIAYDVRHFSKYFCDLTASVWTSLGGEAFVFDGPRSVPQLSFTLRAKKALTGIVITASHNPFYDNGYKVYSSDGAQIMGDFAKGVVDSVKKVASADIAKNLKLDTSKVRTIGKDLEDAYANSINDSIIDKDAMRLNKPKIVYTALHGTGAVMCPPILRRFGLEPILVEEQMLFDPRFPTVKQPNPEYAETLSIGVELAKKTGAECVMGTDPDADRMGAAYRAEDGTMKLLTGNMIGSLLIDYRIRRMLELGIITSPQNCAVLKTFVTSPLQDAIAQSYGVKCVNLLTGFKWIGARIRKYNEILKAKCPDANLDALPYAEKAQLLQKYSSFFVFGCEESYGYLGSTLVRDKDANAAVIMFSEMLAWLKGQGKTLDQYLDDIYMRCGYFLEDLISIYKEGASGSEYIKNFLAGIEKNPLANVAGIKVASVMNFSTDTIKDADGEIVPKEKFFFYKLENDYSFAIRASGTEPKIKFYAFAKEVAKNATELSLAKTQARSTLTEVLNSLKDIFNGK